MAKNNLPKFSHILILAVMVLLSVGVAVGYVTILNSGRVDNSIQSGQPNNKTQASPNAPGNTNDVQYPIHTVVATKFWVGESANESNANIPNHASAWVGDWVGEFGGVDDPNSRCGFDPCGFTPRQNAFYVALPFNDIDSKGNPKNSTILKKIPWYNGQSEGGVSLMKNRWVEVRHGDKVAYGQIEDVGPMYDDDVDYVFGEQGPKYRAGLDLSPALNDYLGVEGWATVQWKFIDSSEVPEGVWGQRITTTQVNY